MSFSRCFFGKVSSRLLLELPTLARWSRAGLSGHPGLRFLRPPTRTTTQTNQKVSHEPPVHSSGEGPRCCCLVVILSEGCLGQIFSETLTTVRLRGKLIKQIWKPTNACQGHLKRCARALKRFAMCLQVVFRQFRWQAEIQNVLGW